MKKYINIADENNIEILFVVCLADMKSMKPMK